MTCVPPEALTVTWKFPLVVVREKTTVRVALPLVAVLRLMVAGDIVTVVTVGADSVVRLTSLEKGETAFIVMVEFTEPPGRAIPLTGVNVAMKSATVMKKAKFVT